MVDGRRLVAAAVAASLTVCLSVPGCLVPPQQIDPYVLAASRSTTVTQDSSTEGNGRSDQSKKVTVRKKKAKKYIGKDLKSLIRAIGRYKKLVKSASCYYEGEYDGIARYSGFTVYCHTEDKKKWIIDRVR